MCGEGFGVEIESGVPILALLGGGSLGDELVSRGGFCCEESGGREQAYYQQTVYTRRSWNRGHEIFLRIDRE
jgi:hypothetical protein